MDTETRIIKLEERYKFLEDKLNLYDYINTIDKKYSEIIKEYEANFTQIQDKLIDLEEKLKKYEDCQSKDLAIVGFAPKNILKNTTETEEELEE